MSQTLKCLVFFQHNKAYYLYTCILPTNHSLIHLSAYSMNIFRKYINYANRKLKCLNIYNTVHDMQLSKKSL